MPSQLTAAERVRAKLNLWANAQGHGARRTLAAAVSGKYGEPMSIQWASGVLSGHQDLRLDQLDAVAALLNVAPGDLVARAGDHYLEVLPSERKFVEHLRSMPDIIRRHLLATWDYFLEAHVELLTVRKDQVDGRTKLAKRLRAAELSKRRA